MGDLFMKNVENISAAFPYVTTAGNHEFLDGKQNIDMYKGWFRGQSLLGERCGSIDPIMWHSYDIGDKLHFIGVFYTLKIDRNNLMK